MTFKTCQPWLSTPDGRQQLLACYRDGLLDDTVRFWFPRSIDTEHGGFLHFLDHDGVVLDTDKSVWAQGRMSWMLLTLYNTFEKKPEWLEWAQSGLRFLDRHCFDSDGRMFFHVTREGLPIRKRRYAFSESANHANSTYGNGIGLPLQGNQLWNPVCNESSPDFC